MKVLTRDEISTAIYLVIHSFFIICEQAPIDAVMVINTKIVYRWFSPDVIAAMLVQRTKEKIGSFRNLTLLLCKT